MINRISVYSHNDFDEKMYRLGIDTFNVEDEPDKAFISIICTPECQKYYLEENEFHWFKNNNHNVLNLEFDDIDGDTIEWKGHTFYGITEEQSKQLVDFIENNKGKNFYIHCKAGKSRSQGVCRYILDVYGDKYGYDQKLSCRKENPCTNPNQRVVRMLKREYYKQLGYEIE